MYSTSVPSPGALEELLPLDSQLPVVLLGSLAQRIWDGA